MKKKAMPLLSVGDRFQVEICQRGPLKLSKTSDLLEVSFYS